MDAAFRAAYRQLNDKQKEAVDAIDGPVLVVAGPGTGKTQLLSVRVANILAKTDTDASSILCLTFTNKAALNMRERLQQLIGPLARDVVVKTFHSFAADIMNQYPDYFWEGARLSVAPDAVQLEIIQSILAGLPSESPLASQFAGAFTALDDVREALKLTKEAGLTPDQLRDIIRQNLAYIDQIEPQLVELLASPLSAKKLPQLEAAVADLPPQELPASSLLLPLSAVLQESLAQAVHEDADTGKTKQTGKWKLRWVQTIEGKKGMLNERRRNNWWLAVADAYEVYRTELHKRGYYDYSDMLVEVLEQMEQSADLRADIQERFLYVLIDEFQDTNAAQLHLAHLVADHYAANNKPNLMAVGDDDQSIFAFNGAELSNMLGFRRSYPDAKLIVLNQNYRSTQAVLDASRNIIEQAEDRLVNRESEISKDLRATIQPQKSSTIEHISYPTREHQLTAVAARIQDLWQASSDGTVAVLARTHDSLKQIAHALLAKDIPVRYDQQSNVLEHEAVQQVCLIAELAVAIANGDRATVNAGIASLLRHPMWRLSNEALWKLAVANYSTPDWLICLLEHQDPALRGIGNWLMELARTSQDQPLGLLMEQLLGLRPSRSLTSPFRAYYLDLQPLTNNYLETLSAVELLQELTQEFSHSEATLADFVRFVQLNLSTRRVIADESWFMSGDKAVQLLTIHKAKGLEFDTVFVIDAVEKTWQPRRTRRASPANLSLQSYGEQYDDYIRLLYVAATRAKHTLIATSYFTDGQGNELLPTPLLAFLPLTKVDQPADQPVTVLETALHWPRLETSNEKALLQDRLERFSLSPTSFIDFMNVAEAGPQSFLERHLLRLPRAHSPTGSYGTAIHAAMETAQRLINTAKLDTGTILDRFEAALADEHLAPIDYERYQVRGQNLIKRLFTENLVGLQKGGLAEQRLSDIYIGDARIGGKLDRLDLQSNKLTISDYKTGKPLASFDTQDKTKAVKAWRHRTQLLFYCLMAGHDSRFAKAESISAQMIYLEAEQTRQLILGLVPDPIELERLLQLIQVVWQHIQNLDFPDTSSYPADMTGIAAFENHLLATNKKLPR